MFRVEVIRIEPEKHPYCSKREYEGFMWGYPTVNQRFTIYECPVVIKERYPNFPVSQWDDMVPILSTSQVVEVVFSGPKTSYFKTNNSLYKVRVLDEKFSFDKPYSDVPLD